MSFTIYGNHLVAENSISAKVAPQAYVQARAAEVEDKLERAARETGANLDRTIREFTEPTRRRIDATHAEMLAQTRSMQTEINNQTRWIVGLGLLIILAVLVRP